MADVQVTIIGGGIVGCATAAACARKGWSTVLLEKDAILAGGTTSRNSEVAHGGMYYREGSLKARFCVAGRRLLKDFCLAHDIGYRECGKLIVAVTPDEAPELERLLALGRANGVEDLRLVDGDDLKRMEPDIRAVAGLFSPRTAILDAEGAARGYAAQAADHGCQVMTDAGVSGLEKQGAQWQVTVSAPDGARRDGWTHSSAVVVNAAGLGADGVAALAGIDVDARRWRQIPVKGNYFGIDPAHYGRINHLVYPVPPADASSLGIHVCLDLGGRLRLGPDLDLAAGPDLSYGVDPALGEAFFQDTHRYLPWLKPSDLTPDMSGFRPKLKVDGFRDFVVEAETDDNAGLINLVGIDSPGLTSAPALAAEVARLAALSLT